MISLTIFFLVEFEKEKSEYNLFLNYLPKSLQDQPLFFNLEKLEFLKGSFLYDNYLIIWKKQLQSEYDSLIKINIVDLFKIKEFTFEKYIFFRALVWSRNFNTKLKLNGYNLKIYEKIDKIEKENNEDFKFNADTDIDIYKKYIDNDNDNYINNLNNNNIEIDFCKYFELERGLALGLNNNKEKEKEKKKEINDEIEISSLIPVADMFNTDPNKINTDWSFDEINGKFILKANREIQEDEEVIDNN
jgi:hypothetical protein